jgi:glucose-specific phosphotransferase system IIA component
VGERGRVVDGHGVTVVSPLSGTVVPLERVADQMFAERVMGEGVAVRPDAADVLAPVAGRLAKLFPGGHGMAIATVEGVEVLVHVGLETVRLRGDGFEVVATEGSDVEAGDLLVRVDLDRLAALGVDAISPVVIISDHAVRAVASGYVRAGEPLFEVVTA